MVGRHEGTIRLLTDTTLNWLVNERVHRRQRRPRLIEACKWSYLLSFSKAPRTLHRHYGRDLFTDDVAARRLSFVATIADSQDDCLL